MNKLKLLIFSFLFTTQLFEAQCDPTIFPNFMTGCAPLQVVCAGPLNASAAWVIGTTTLNVTNFTYTFATPAVYIVTLTTVTNGTCFGAATLTVNVVTGSANGCTNTIQGLQSVFDKSELFIFPNPTSDNIGISISGITLTDQFSYLITNNFGQYIRQEELQGNTITTYDLAPGLYFIHLKTRFGSFIKKFVKTN